MTGEWQGQSGAKAVKRERIVLPPLPCAWKEVLAPNGARLGRAREA